MSYSGEFIGMLMIPRKNGTKASSEVIGEGIN